jgi:hypothetical protein
MQILRGATVLLLVSSVALVPTEAQAQKQKPADASHQDQDHDHGFKQGGKHDTVAKDVTLEEKLDAAAHIVTLREGPITLPANTDHRKMPQLADPYRSVPVDGWLIGADVRSCGHWAARQIPVVIASTSPALGGWLDRRCDVQPQYAAARLVRLRNR